MSEVPDYEGFRSGFVTLIGRPNVGKSTLLNAICGEKVAITSDKAQTTRTQVRGVYTVPTAQLVFVDTPGIHKPRSALGERLNKTASSGLSDVDVACLVIDAVAPLGPGDRFVAAKLPKDSVVASTSADIAKPDQILDQLAKAGALEFDAYFPVSARTGDGVPSSSSTSSAGCPRAPSTTRMTKSPTRPTRFGWPSSSGSNCYVSPRKRCRTRSPRG